MIENEKYFLSGLFFSSFLTESGALPLFELVQFLQRFDQLKPMMIIVWSIKDQNSDNFHFSRVRTVLS